MSIAGLTRSTIEIAKIVMKHTLTLCKNVKWMQEWTLSPKGVNMKKKTIKIKQVSETDAEKRLFKTLKKMGLA